MKLHFLRWILTLFQGIQQRTEDMLEEAKSFNENAKELHQIMYWRHMKLKVILGITGVAGTMSFIMPMLEKLAA